MLDKHLVLIGGGNMGGALVRGIRAADLIPARKITVVDLERRVLEELEESYGVAVTDDAAAVVPAAEILLLAVKPYLLGDVLDGLKAHVRPEQLVVSVVAGVEGSTIQGRLGRNNPVVRVMPNVAATVGAAASGITACPPATEEHLEIVERMFAAVGAVARVSEAQMDAVTGLSGSGPAYVYTVIEALCEGGVRMGLPPDVARKLATQTVLGAALVVQTTGEHPAVLRDRVTTPGGTTIAGLHALEAGGLRAALSEAVRAATERSRELGRASNDE